MGTVMNSMMFVISITLSFVLVNTNLSLRIFIYLFEGRGLAPPTPVGSQSSLAIRVAIRAIVSLSLKYAMPKFSLVTKGQNGDSTPAVIRAWTPAIALMISWIVACVSRSAVVVVIRDTIPLGLANTNLTQKYFLTHISQ